MPDAGLPPLPESEWDDETRAMLSPDLPGGGRVLNIFATLSRHPKLMKRWLVFGSHVLAKSTLPAHDRELLILRTGLRCRAPYEWGQHVVIAAAAGITDVEIAQVAAGPDDRGWDPFEATLLRAADELHDNLCVSEPDVAHARRALHGATAARSAVLRRSVPPRVDGAQLAPGGARRQRRGRAVPRAKHLTASAGARHFAELLHERHHVDDVPVLDHLAVAYADDVDHVPRNLSAGPA